MVWRVNDFGSGNFVWLLEGRFPQTRVYKAVRGLWRKSKITGTKRRGAEKKAKKGQM